ncbi:hypothetical protein C8Q72DRAFT_860106 [Fomitopsis betulina]|nr:hypothetical protein C8Q72DRAFT_860106 [Fomitopsis betulina]
MGALFIGLVLSAIFQGITTMQAIFYYTTYPKDTRCTKSMVAILWALDMTSITISIIAYGLYTLSSDRLFGSICSAASQLEFCH